jgi:tRNA dimethylallyltransferase
VIVGPTASGKTELAIELAAELGGEIVSADSVQVYRHFEIGTGKPSAEERARAPHHLIDILEPEEPIDAADWAVRAEAAISDISSRGKKPIVCGGSCLWVRALILGLAPLPGADAEVRARHGLLAEREGRAALHRRLAEVDTASAERLAPNDFVRVSRALEVFELTGTPMSEWQARHGFRNPRRPARLIGVRRERAELDERILARTERMLARGLVDEVRRLLSAGYGGTRAFGSVGYREIKEALAEGRPFDEAELADRITRATRRFARRQRTWLRDQPVEWLPPGSTKLW